MSTKPDDLMDQVKNLLDHEPHEVTPTDPDSKKKTRFAWLRECQSLLVPARERTAAIHAHIVELKPRAIAGALSRDEFDQKQAMEQELLSLDRLIHHAGAASGEITGMFLPIQKKQRQQSTSIAWIATNKQVEPGFNPLNSLLLAKLDRIKDELMSEAAELSAKIASGDFNELASIE